MHVSLTNPLLPATGVHIGTVTLEKARKKFHFVVDKAVMVQLMVLFVAKYRIIVGRVIKNVTRAVLICEFF